jgi:hypothetical protein
MNRVMSASTNVVLTNETQTVIATSTSSLLDALLSCRYLTRHGIPTKYRKAFIHLVSVVLNLTNSSTQPCEWYETDLNT